MNFVFKTLPLSTNALYHGRRFLTEDAKRNKRDLALEAKMQFIPRMPLEGAISLTVTFYWPNHRKHDIDNIKGFLDSFTGILYDDDSQIQSLHLFKYVDAKNPRVELSISAIS